MNQCSASTAAPYQGAQAHYLSPRRRDPVKILMEEVASQEIFANAVRKLGLGAGQRLRVLDLGCGIGDGLTLLTDVHGGLPPAVDGHPLDYVGLDADADMVATARSVHAGRSASFLVGDMRDQLPAGDVDLYLSCGVPYSHLTVDEISAVLTEIMARVVAGRRRAVLVIDVLGRFSIEWTPKWPETRWDYAMTFFEDTAARPAQPMTFFDRAGLAEVIAAAARRARARPHDIVFTDRSILVGRHTATRAFNPSIPPYRTLVNELARGSSDVALDELRFDPPAHGAPPATLAFFNTFAERWNTLVEQAGQTRPALASALLRCERQEQRGLGAGHSLTATVVIDAS